jgi:hypothetical protein
MQVHYTGKRQGPDYKDQVREDPQRTPRSENQVASRAAIDANHSAALDRVTTDSEEEPIVAVAVESGEEEDRERLVELEQRLQQAEERLNVVEREPIVSAVPIISEGDAEEAEAGSASAAPTDQTQETEHDMLALLESRKGRFYLLLVVMLLAATALSVVLGVALSGDGDEAEKDSTPSLPTIPRKFCHNSSCWVQIGGDMVGPQDGDRFGWPLSLVAGGNTPFC